MTFTTVSSCLCLVTLLLSVAVDMVSSNGVTAADTCETALVPFHSKAEAQVYAGCYCRVYRKLYELEHPTGEDFDGLIEHLTTDATTFGTDGYELDYRSYRKAFKKMRGYIRYLDVEECKMKEWSAYAWKVKVVFSANANFTIFNVSTVFASFEQLVHTKFDQNGKFLFSRQNSLDGGFGRIGKIVRYFKESADAEESAAANGVTITFLDEFRFIANFIRSDWKLSAAIAVVIAVIAFSALLVVYVARKCVGCLCTRLNNKNIYTGIQSQGFSSETDTETETETETETGTITGTGTASETRISNKY